LNPRDAQSSGLCPGEPSDGHETFAAAVDVYADAFRRVSRPTSTSPAIFRQSSFYRIGSRYLALLEDAGRGAEANNVRAQLRQGEDKDKG